MQDSSLMCARETIRNTGKEVHDVTPIRIVLTNPFANRAAVNELRHQILLPFEFSRLKTTLELHLSRRTQTT